MGTGKPQVRSAAVYARISADQGGQGLGVQRQLEDCRKLAADRGWVIGAEYVDNDISAYSGKPRPAYARMIADVTGGLRDAVLVYNLDRLHRRPVELEEFVTLCEKAGVREVATVTADIDLGNDDGLFMARIFAAFAAKESGRRSARIRRKMDQNATAGLPHGPVRPFGYEDDKITIREEEAAIIRVLVDRFLAGESVRSLASWLNTTEVPTPGGGENWKTGTLRQMLCSARLAGLRAHRGQIVGQAVWAPIIAVEKREQVLARFASRAASGRRAPRTHLLSGLLRCGKCGNTLYSSSRQVSKERRSRRYVCLSGPDHGGCGRLTVVSEPVEALISEAGLTRLDSRELADALSGRSSGDGALAALGEALAADQAQLEELAGLYATGQVTAREWMAARNPIESRIRDTQRRLAHATETSALDGLLGNVAVLRGQWDTLGIDRRHAIIRAILDHAVIGPGSPAARSVDIARVQPQWRL